MKVIIEIENERDMEIIKPLIEKNSVRIINSHNERQKKLDSLFDDFSIKLPEDYSFNREELHER